MWKNDLYLHLYKIHGHQTLKGFDLFWDFPTHKATRIFDHVITRGHVAN